MNSLRNFNRLIGLIYVCINLRTFNKICKFIFIIQQIKNTKHELHKSFIRLIKNATYKLGYSSMECIKNIKSEVKCKVEIQTQLLYTRNAVY